ncbi:MAG TPA: HU family DNA-binding protein [bacterium]|nr:HU family DNA-binding protein [bacterium]
MPDKNFINPKELAEIIANKKTIEIGKKQIEEIIKTLTDVIIERIKSGQTVKLTGFGAFILKDRYARGGVNPRNPQERIKIPAVKVAKFKAGKKLKDALKK